MDAFQQALSLLPERMKNGLEGSWGAQAEEIRLRCGYRPSVLIDGRERHFSQENVSAGELMGVLERATGASLHSAAAQLLEGYISCRGLRVGVCATAVLRDGAPVGLKHYSSVAIRIPRELTGICKNAVREICADGFESTLIISPPGGGKTTALREIVRSLSEMGYRVGVIDERGELAGGGAEGLDFRLGEHSDVLSGMDKARGGMLLLRGMNPQIIAMDEITKPADVKAISEIYGCGVMLLASAHAKNLDDLAGRGLYRELLDLGIFRYFIEISGHGSGRTYIVKRRET